MSICRGIAGARGKNPIGIFIHNDAGSANANAAFYKGWLPSHNLSAGFAHYYVAQDGILQAEDDANRAWHCGQTDGNNNYLSIEVCQSMGDLETFKNNEEKALQLAAQKCKQYGITPSTSTIRLHQEVSATACPHRSVEIHGGASGAKAYFIKRIGELMGMNIDVSVSMPQASAVASSTPTIYFKYRVRTKEDGWLPEVINLADYAGIPGHAITDISIGVDRGSLWYQVHVKGGVWLPTVSGYNINDYNNGYAGNGQVIDAVRVYYNTPADYAAQYGYQKAQYRVSPLNGNYWPWQYDNETGAGQDGYAGAFGQAIDRFQLF
ncbi:MAG TPA: N-acetylmuramoyl-L-alanine amidase [Candidatus Mediterraneibacter intestinipullorum]|nr:N-acetylmuramoyl-L-alanine amidase [Candidatus Mediterraneibacter intestinipullorum]